METDGRQGDEGRHGTHPPDNVVQFPRDWYGPKEELVPLGPRASMLEAGEPVPVRPDDFWGEGSAAIHDVLQGPPVDTAAALVAAPAAPLIERRPRLVYTRARELVRVLVRDVGGLVDAVRVPPLRLASRPVPVLAGVLALLVCAAAVLGQIEGAPRAVRVSATDRTRGEIHAASGVNRTAVDSTWRGAALFLALRRAADLKGVDSRPARVRKTHPSRLVPAQPAPASSPAPTYVSAPVSSSSEPVARVASASGGGSGTSSSGTGGAAGPQGPGAPFGPGHLG